MKVKRLLIDFIVSFSICFGIANFTSVLRIIKGYKAPIEFGFPLFISVVLAISFQFIFKNKASRNES